MSINFGYRMDVCAHPGCYRVCRALLLGLVGLLLVACAEEQGEGRVDNGPQLGQVALAPLSDAPAETAGPRVALSEFHGKTLIINFWATWCGPCREEMPALQSLSEQLDRQRYAVIGVSVDEQANVARQFLDDHDITFAQFHDPQMALTLGPFQISAFPETLVIGPEGVLLRRIVGAREWDDPAYYQTLFAE